MLVIRTYCGKIVMKLFLVKAISLIAMFFLSVQIYANKAPYYLPLSTQGNKIVDNQGKEFILQGVNWFGFETQTQLAHGLWSRDYKEMLIQIKSLGYNTLRLPFSIQAMRSTKLVEPNVSNGMNQALIGKTPIEALEVIIDEANRQDLLIILDNHSLANDSHTYDLWYNETYSEQDWLDHWNMMAARFKKYPNVIGADVKNEPHGRATWGTGDATDWRLAAQKAGNVIHSVAPEWLIIVEGIESWVEGQQLPSHWWGGNLEGVRHFPVELKKPNKLVYSLHEYGPGVYPQPWFDAPNMEEVLIDRWYKGFGYIHEENIAPILVGEFGGKLTDRQTKEGQWQNLFVDYLIKHKMSWTYWSWNPNSVDTGGILKDDWLNIQVEKQQMLTRLLGVDNNQVH